MIMHLHCTGRTDKCTGTASDTFIEIPLQGRSIVAVRKTTGGKNDSILTNNVSASVDAAFTVDTFRLSDIDVFYDTIFLSQVTNQFNTGVLTVKDLDSKFACFDRFLRFSVDFHTLFDTGITSGDDEALAAFDRFDYADTAGTDGSHLFVIAKSRDLDVEFFSCL
jgi:hypothetical protein